MVGRSSLGALSLCVHKESCGETFLEVTLLTRGASGSEATLECWLHGAGHKSANYFLTLFTCALCSKVCLATGPTIWSGLIFSMQNVFLYPLWEGGLGKPCWPKSKLFAHENKNLVRSIILCIKAPTARACNRVRTRWVRQFPIHPFWAVIS